MPRARERAPPGRRRAASHRPCRVGVCGLLRWWVGVPLVLWHFEDTEAPLAVKHQPDSVLAVKTPSGCAPAAFLRLFYAFRGRGRCNTVGFSQVLHRQRLQEGRKAMHVDKDASLIMENSIVAFLGVILHAVSRQFLRQHCRIAWDAAVPQKAHRY